MAANVSIDDGDPNSNRDCYLGKGIPEFIRKMKDAFTLEMSAVSSCDA